MLACKIGTIAIHHDIAACPRMIFLPSIGKPMVFNILTYAKEDVEIPDGWEATHPHAVEDGDHDDLKAFNALLHTVGVSVSYRDEE